MTWMTRLLVTVCTLTVAPAWATDYQEVERRLGDLVADGKLTLDQARVMLDALQEHDDKEGEQDAGSQEGKPDPVETFYEYLESVGPQLAEAVEAGEVTEQQAWEKWLTIKEQKIVPWLKQLVDTGGLSEAEGWGVWFKIEMTETGERLKSAVRRGELTEQEAMEKWQAYEAEMDAKWAELQVKLDGQELAE
ncbi:MAG: hypothetical protein AAGC44_13130 [Planctomycetota bacterium]